MELKRILGKDNRQAMEEVVRLYGPDALVVSGHKINGKFELIIAVDIEADSDLIDVPDTELTMDAPKSPHIGLQKHRLKKYYMSGKNRLNGRFINNLRIGPRTRNR